jgi:uracil-DNA glycosylase family 4
MNQLALAELQAHVIACIRCPRLVRWREQAAEEKPRRYADWNYWARPVPSFGDPQARLLIVGLAPAAHGANRTGRMFTGDRSGEWLYRALHKFGFANQPNSTDRDDGLELRDCYITAALHCAPPENKPLPEELKNCRPFLIREFELLMNFRVVVALGRIAFEAVLRSFKDAGRVLRPNCAFAHGAELKLNDRLTLIASFHPSQQNTFTGKLTEPMFDAVFRRARELMTMTSEM